MKAINSRACGQKDEKILEFQLVKISGKNDVHDEAVIEKKPPARTETHNP